MISFAPKTYQQQVLDSVEAYFKACHELPSPSIAFTATTERLWGRGNPYNPLSGFPADMPYFCLRVPTGGGKTWLAAKSVQLVNTHLLRCEHSVILWLVPSKPIREQTLKGLKDRITRTTRAARSRADHGAGSGRSQERDPRHAGHFDHDHRRHPAGVPGGRGGMPQGVPVQRRADAPLRQPVAHAAR
jgi:hypothetical protein